MQSHEWQRHVYVLLGSRKDDAEFHDSKSSPRTGERRNSTHRVRERNHNHNIVHR